ncbi:MAG: PIN domain-containing protein [Pseudomonadota bacterium]
MLLTYILVDFENVQPTDMGLLTGEQYQLMIFRGPHQNKLDFDIVEAIQPLGDRVRYIQSHKQGKNALDFHIAFQMGRLIEEIESKPAGERGKPHFVVISNDGGFDALLSHIHTLGYGATKAANIRQALRLSAGATPAENPSNSVAATPSIGQVAVPNKAAPARPSPPAKKSSAVTPIADKAGDKTQVPVRKALGKEDKDKVIDNLRKHPNKRPVKRKTLENHIQNLLGSNLSERAVRGLLAMLENEGVIKFDGPRIIEYKLPKAKKAKGENG